MDNEPGYNCWLEERTDEKSTVWLGRRANISQYRKALVLHPVMADHVSISRSSH